MAKKGKTISKKHPTPAKKTKSRAAEYLAERSPQTAEDFAGLLSHATYDMVQGDVAPDVIVGKVSGVVNTLLRAAEYKRKYGNGKSLSLT